jgi:hypothetical protein
VLRGSYYYQLPQHLTSPNRKRDKTVFQAAKQQVEANVSPANVPALTDPSILKAARNIYRLYYEVHPNVSQRPLGVVINRTNYRGKLIFSNKPILLPTESFVAFNEIESELF